MSAEDASSRKPNLPLWLVGILAMGGAAALGLSRQPTTPPAGSPPAEAGKKAETAELDAPDGPLDVLRDYLRLVEKPESEKTMHWEWKSKSDTSSETVVVDIKTVAGEKKPSLVQSLQTDPAEYEFLIATVPDPVETKFPHEFDAVLAGIQRAYEARRFTLCASWMPWPQDTDRARSRSSHSKRSPHDYPGVLLFRKSRTDQELSSKTGSAPLAHYALVCLVGETPVAGIYKPALDRALQARRELGDKFSSTAEKLCSCAAGEKRRSDWAVGEARRVALIAPQFSGSQASLAVALKSWKDRDKPTPRLEIISGSASGLRPSLFNNYGLDTPQTTVIPNDVLTYLISACRGG